MLQDKIDALWNRANADPKFLTDNLEAIERIVQLIDVGDVELAEPLIDKICPI